MAHLSEFLVEEYFNRKKYFTIRGAKQGVGEMDILGIRKKAEEDIQGIHAEVQTSFRPVSYLSNTNAGKREYTTLKADMERWLDKKFRSETKTRLRNSIYPGIKWQFIFVYARLKDEREKDIIAEEGITIITFSEILTELIKPVKKGAYTTSSGGDFVEVLRYLSDETNTDSKC